MSSPTYVTQNEYPLDDDTTLMSTTDVHSYITHANDTFVQVSGYQLDELTGQPLQYGAPPPRYAKSRVCRYVVRCTGRAVERDCQKPAQKR
jgi:hypothetical protein